MIPGRLLWQHSGAKSIKASEECCGQGYFMAIAWARVACLICTPRGGGPRGRPWHNRHAPYNLPPGKLEACKSIVSIGIRKVVGVDCGILLTRNFQCIVFIVKDTHSDCGFCYHFCIASIII